MDEQLMYKDAVLCFVAQTNCTEEQALSAIRKSGVEATPSISIPNGSMVHRIGKQL